MFRKIIYIGESDGNTIYFDTENNVALSASKSRLMNTQPTQALNKFIPFLIGISILSSLGFLTLASPFGGYYSYGTLLFLMILWIAEFLGLIFLMERALYKNVKFAKVTDKSNFRIALYSNMIWNNFNDKKVTLQKKIVWWILIVVVLIVNMSIFPIMKYSIIPDIENKIAIDSGIIISCLWGLMPAVLVLMIWQNNPIRFLNIAEKYQKRELKWGIDIKNNQNSD